MQRLLEPPKLTDITSGWNSVSFQRPSAITACSTSPRCHGCMHLPALSAACAVWSRSRSWRGWGRGDANRSRGSELLGRRPGRRFHRRIRGWGINNGRSALWGARRGWWGAGLIATVVPRLIPLLDSRRAWLGAVVTHWVIPAKVGESPRKILPTLRVQPRGR